MNDVVEMVMKKLEKEGEKLKRRRSGRESQCPPPQAVRGVRARLESS